jgi:beta-lactamase class A
VYLKERMEDDGYLIQEKDARGGYFRTRFRGMEIDEEAFRDRVTDSARAYLGTQYRWGGKSAQGLDCSGLVFMSYFENGVLIYRDAHILPEYPVNAIAAEELKKGDMIFFPGHVALYLGDGRYIHSTAHAATPCVTINSLNPGDSDFRADLLEQIEGYGSVFTTGNTGANEETASTESGILADVGKTVCDRSESCGKTTEDDCKRPAECSISAVYWTALDARLAALPGNTSFVFRDLTSGETHTYLEQQPHLAASIIKLFLMAAVFQGIEDGTIHADDLIEVRRADCVPSCGVLTYLPEERRVSVRDLVELMIIVSDNTAANLLFDLVGEEKLAHFIRDTLGLEQTVFRRKMFDAKRAAQGIENYVTAADAAALLEKIWRRELVSEQASETMYQILTHQRLNGKIPFRLHTLKPQPVIAHKTGEDTGVTHDVAIVAGEHPFLLCFLGSSTDVPAYERLMADVAEEIYRMMAHMQ